MKDDCSARHHQEDPVTPMGQVLEVSVSGYDAWKQRSKSARQLADERLSACIQQVHEATHQISGRRRRRAELAEQGRSCGRKRVVRLMRKRGLKARQRRHRTVTTDSQHRDPVAPTLLDRDCSATSSYHHVGDAYDRRMDGAGLALGGDRA